MRACRFRYRAAVLQAVYIIPLPAKALLQVLRQCDEKRYPDGACRTRLPLAKNRQVKNRFYRRLRPRRKKAQKQGRQGQVPVSFAASRLSAPAPNRDTASKTFRIIDTALAPLHSRFHRIVRFG